MWKSRGKTPVKLLYRHALARAALAEASASHQSDASVVVWVPPVPLVRSIGSDNTCRDAALSLALHRRGIRHQIVRDQRLGHLRGKSVYLHIGTDFNPLGVSNYAAIWPYLIGELEAQGNRVFPSREESLLWENKAHMHELFQARGVRCPHTELVPASELEEHCARWTYPYLLKEIHSSSSEGVHQIDSPERLRSVAARIQARSRSEIVLVQELLNMRRDLRAIVIGDEVALHYWRINLQDEWRPTATGHGSRVDFVHFPEQWRADIVATLRTCGLQQGAFDIAWRGDDLTTEPIYLEVSPQFQPNPPVAEGELDMNYGAWKKALILGDRGYDKRFFDTLVRLADRYVAVTLGLG